MSKILIIEDDRMWSKMIYHLLFDEYGHDVTATENLKDGLREIHSKIFDVVLLDVQLPDGKEMAGNSDRLCFCLPNIHQRDLWISQNVYECEVLEEAARLCGGKLIEKSLGQQL